MSETSPSHPWHTKWTGVPSVPKFVLRAFLLLITSCAILYVLLSGRKERLSAWMVPYLQGFSVQKISFLAPTQEPRVGQKCGPVPGRLFVPFTGRLGNIMFEYASTLAIARRLGMTLALRSNNKLLKIFKVEPDTIVTVINAKNDVRYERFACAYDPKLLEIPCGRDISLCCYLQSWKYLTGFEHEIRAQFQFRRSVLAKAQSVWDSVILPATRRNLSGYREGKRRMQLGVESPGRDRPVFVAVHVRRGDKASNPVTIRNGHIVASEQYLQNGYRFFQNRYNNNVLFVVSSDDPAWTRKALPSSASVFVSSDRPEVDMAVLSRCNHTLMTVGTYSWWVAWLVNGTTVYYKTLFQPETHIAKAFNNTTADWVLPHWIAME